MKFLQLLVLLAVAAEAQDVEKTHGGNTCDTKKVPWLVSLEDIQPHCVGALISPSWVITSAHCYNPSMPNLPEQGKQNLRGCIPDDDERRLLKFIREDILAVNTQKKGIIMLKMASPVTLNANVNTVSLPSSCAAVGTTCVSSGWGGAPSNGMSLPNVQCGNATILNSNQCSGTFPDEITDNMICVNDEESGKDSCQSGRPLVCDGQLQGIASWGLGCGQKNKRIAYTKICNYVDWIRSVIDAN